MEIKEGREIFMIESKGICRVFKKFVENVYYEKKGQVNFKIFISKSIYL